MTIKFNNVYVKDTALVAGKLESRGPMSKYFDKKYIDYYMDKESVDLSEVKLQNDSIDILLKKANTNISDIDLISGGDLLNQISATCYAVEKYNVPFLGLFSACATSMESVIVSSTMIDNGSIKNAICVTSSHNLSSEKQFRNPIEYGAPKPSTATFTATGGASILLSNEKSNIKISCGTIGRIVNYKQKDVNNMGAVMAPAAADTIYNHLKNMNESISDYDLILTGDLGLFGKEILKDVMIKKYNIDISDKYNDCGVMLYDIKKEKDITAGGSGPVCSCLVNYGYILEMMKIKKYKKVLFVTTGALFSPTFAYMKQDLLGIAHAVCMEVVE